MNEDGDEFHDEIEEEDYIFVIDSEGNLKSYALPEHLECEEEMPESIKKIMKIFKQQRVFNHQTIH